MKRDRSCHAVHGEIAENVAALRSGSLDASAPERDLGKFFHVKEFRAAKMVVAFFDVRVDAPHVNLRRDRGILRMLPVDVDLAAEPCEFTMGGAEKLMHGEANRGAGRIELVGLVCPGGGAQRGDDDRSDNIGYNPSRKLRCHVKRSETSRCVPIASRSRGNQRFFASLRMTECDCW